MHLRRLEHLLAIVGETLRSQFPDDFHKRCAYATFGTLALLRDEQREAFAVGGDFMAFVMSQDTRRAGLQGFGFGEGQCSHFWVEAENRLIDLGPHFLPQDSSFPAVPMPAVAWNLAEPLPRAIRYRPVARFPADAAMSDDPTISTRCAEFVRRCRQHRDSQTELTKFPTWIVTGKPSIRIAANRHDLWALGAERFETFSANQDLLF